MKNIKTTRISKGFYKITRQGRVFTAEQVEDGQWQLLETFDKPCDVTGLMKDDEYLNHFLDLKSCKILINDYFNELSR